MSSQPPPRRYLVARLVAGLWHHWEANPSHPLALHYNSMAKKAEGPLSKVREADQHLRNNLLQLQRVREAIKMGPEERGQQAEQRMRTVMEEAGERFSSANPMAIKLTRSRESFEQALAHEQAIMNEGLELERQQGNSQVAALIAKHFGTTAYTARGLEKWKDERIAKKVGYTSFMETQKQLMAKLDRARAQLSIARGRLDSDQAEMESSWADSGMRYVNPESLDDARQWQSLSEASEEALEEILKSLEQEGSLARRALNQAVLDFHAQVGNEMKPLISRADPHDNGKLLGPGINPAPFIHSKPGSTLDRARLETLRKTHLSFLGQGASIASDVPEWVLLAYGNTEGLPGATMAQSGMGAGLLTED